MAEKDKMEYFITQTNERLKTIDENIKELLKFKWQIIGGSVSLSLIITLAVQAAIYMVTKGV